MKVLGVGLNKTGTTTLGACLHHWGLKHTSCHREAFNLWRNDNYEEILTIAEEFDSFEDWPWPLIYKEIDEKFPNTKFILTRRINSDTWYKSLCKHAKRTGPTDFRKYIYGYEMPHQHKKEHILFYEKHLDSVREYFYERQDNFLEVCWEEGDGWDELSSFLGFERPKIPFPHEKKSPTMGDNLKELVPSIKKSIKTSIKKTWKPN